MICCYNTKIDVEICVCAGCIMWRARRSAAGTHYPSSPYPRRIDIEIGRYALRTFDVRSLVAGRLGSVVKRNFSWTGGVAIAECLTDHPCASPPGDGCCCGLYGTLQLSHLVRQYPADARESVAVFAAEGPTIIGDDALRTSAGRVVAYWCDHPNALGTYRAQCPDARHYQALSDMLEAYHFEPYLRLQDACRLGVFTDVSKLKHLLSLATPGGELAVRYTLRWL